MSSSLAVGSTNIAEDSIRLVVNNISRLKSLRSRPIIVGSLLWQIEIAHRDHSGKIGGGENALAIYLHSLNGDHSNWSCAAMATVELATFGVDRQSAPLIKVIGPWTFNRRELSWSRNSFIRWVDLFDRKAGYVRNNRIQLDIKIAAQNFPTPAFLMYQHILNVFQFNFRVENVRDLLAADSGAFGFSDLKWKIVVRKNRFHDVEHSYMGIMLYCIPSNVNTTNIWSRNIFAEFRLRAEQPNALPNHCVQRFCETTKYTNNSRCHGIPMFIKWCDLMNPQNGFVQNNHITLTVNIRDDSAKGNGSCSSNRNNNNSSDIHPMAIIGNRSYPIVYRISSLFDHIENENDATDNSNGNGNGQGDDKENASPTTNDLSTTINDPATTISCPICLGSMVGQEIMSTACGHVYCKNCILTSMKTRKRCPNCQAYLDADKIHPLYLP